MKSQSPDDVTNTHSAGLTSVFVRRPVFALVVNTLIVVAGLAGLLGAEIRELPEVDRPVITITTEYAGAAPETVDRELTAIIEGGVGRVPGIKSISSSSRFGRSSVTVEFSDETDLNAAAADTRDAMGRIASTIPQEADDPRIVKADSNASPVLRMAITSSGLSVQDLTILVEDEVVDRLFAVPGVADLRVYGDREKIFRVDIDQMKLASLGLSVADLRSALSNLVFDTPAGSLTSRSQDIVVRTSSEIATPDAFESLIVRDEVRVRDVATVTLGPDPGDTTLRANGATGVGIAVIRQAQSNSLEISRDVRKTVDRIQEILPGGVSIFVTSDDARFINSAISEVLRTLILAIAIVVAIIFLFLRDWRATLISSGYDACCTDRHFGGVVPGRVFGQHPHPVGAGARNRDGCRRRHRCAGKHRAAAIAGYGSACRGCRRHERGFLCRCHHHCDAGGRLCSLVVSARANRRIVS